MIAEMLKDKFPAVYY